MNYSETAFLILLIHNYDPYKGTDQLLLNMCSPLNSVDHVHILITMPSMCSHAWHVFMVFQRCHPQIYSQQICLQLLQCHVQQEAWEHQLFEQDSN